MELFESVSIALEFSLRVFDTSGELMILRRAYFSLMEMMVVIAIIGFLAGVMVMNFDGISTDAGINTTKATIRQVSDAIKMYKLSAQKYPSTDEGLQLLIDAGKLETYPKDAWGEKIHYQYPGTDKQPFDLWSTGPDRLDGGDGENADIYNRPDEDEQ
jgi:general secretion pathway protein G